VNLGEPRAAVVGIGFVGMAHVDALRRLGIDVAAVVGSDPDRARQKAAAANLPPVVDSLDDLLADPSIDVVHIATPNHLHASQVKAVLAAGKHVVCEKPLGVSSAETADLVACAAASSLVAAVCFNLRFYPINHQMAAMVRADEIGAPRLVSGSFLQDWLLLDTDWNWRLDPSAGGELQALGDIGSHWLDLARFVIGQDVVEVMADVHTMVPVRQRTASSSETFSATNDRSTSAVEMSGDDAATVLLRFADGAKGTMTVSQVAAGHKNSLNLEVHGSTDSISWGSESPDELWIGHRGRPNERIQRDPSAMDETASAISTYPVGHVEGYGDTFRGMFSQVYADIAAGGPCASPRYPTKETATSPDR
jgi:predicted dehydrogenase